MRYRLRTEQLIHENLGMYRWKELDCNSGKGCGKSHKEWFDLTKKEAMATLECWKLWSDSEPYDDAGNLKDYWCDALESLRREPPEPRDCLLFLDSWVREWTTRWNSIDGISR